MKIGEQIKALRLKQKLTQYELGLMIDYSESQLSLVENGLRDPSMWLLRQIADALKVELEINLRED